MATSTIEMEVTGATSIAFTEETMTAELADGRTISVPLEWYPRLLHASISERNNCEIHAEGQHIHWPELDEDLSVRGLLAGWPSGESEHSFKRWLDAKKAGKA